MLAGDLKWSALPFEAEAGWDHDDARRFASHPAWISRAGRRWASNLTPTLPIAIAWRGRVGRGSNPRRYYMQMAIPPGRPGIGLVMCRRLSLQ